MTSLPEINLFQTLFENDQLDSPAGRKGRIFSKICVSKNPTRKKLSKAMEIRPATMSEIVLELISDGLILEARPDHHHQKGRPEIFLKPNPNRLVAITCFVVSHTVNCVVVNLVGDVLHKIQHESQAGQINNDAFLEIVTGLYEDCIAHIPGGSDLAGVAFSFPGIVDEIGGLWHYSAHWSKIRGLALNKLADRIDTRITVSKNLNCELRARISRGDHPISEGLLLLHWGYGIGAAFARGGSAFTSENRGFGEVGHGCVDPASQALCKCGMIGCVEAEAGLWALSKKLTSYDLPREEWEFEQFLLDNPGLDIWERPINLMALTLRNLCVTLSPHHCVITGPFAQNAPIFNRLVARFEELLPASSFVVGENRIKLRASRAGTRDEITGAASNVFQPALRQLCAD